MMDILMGQDLWEYVDGLTTQLMEVALLPVWHKKDWITLSMICLQVADKILVYVVSSTSVVEAWGMLKLLSETQGALGIVQACQKIILVSMCRRNAH